MPYPFRGKRRTAGSKLLKPGHDENIERSIVYRFVYRFAVRFLVVLPRFEVFFGTFAPAALASERPIAIACLRLVTFRPERPLFKVPALRSFIARSTLADAFFEYFRAMIVLRLQVNNLRRRRWFPLWACWMPCIRTPAAPCARVVSGLIFLLPTERRLTTQIKSIEESQKEIEDRLEQFRRHRGEA
jgi:hypothetical protein